jgi:hypothetical protein
MSWHVFAFKFADDIRSISELPSDWELKPIGKASDIRDWIQEVIPIVDFTDPARGVIKTSEFVIEVGLGDEETLNSISFRVVGNAAAATHAISDILRRMDVRGYDVSTGELFELESAIDSASRWMEWRDRVLKDQTNNPD